MSSVFFTLTLISFICCALFLITSVVLFFAFKIPAVVRDMRGSLEQKQIEEIRIKNTGAAMRKGTANIFEELEEKAKPRNNNAKVKLSVTAGISETGDSAGTTVLHKSPMVVNKNFRIEKNIIFVSTSEMLR